MRLDLVPTYTCAFMCAYKHVQLFVKQVQKGEFRFLDRCQKLTLLFFVRVKSKVNDIRKRTVLKICSGSSRLFLIGYFGSLLYNSTWEAQSTYGFLPLFLNPKIFINFNHSEPATSCDLLFGTCILDLTLSIRNEVHFQPRISHWSKIQW